MVNRVFEGIIFVVIAMLAVGMVFLLTQNVSAQEVCEKNPYFSGGGCISDRAYYDAGVLTLPKVDVFLEDDTVTAKNVDLQWNGACFELEE